MAKYINSQKMKFVSRLFGVGFCRVESIDSIKLKEGRDYITIKFNLKIVKNDLPCPYEFLSSFYKVYKK